MVSVAVSFVVPSVCYSFMKGQCDLVIVHMQTQGWEDVATDHKAVAQDCGIQSVFRGRLPGASHVHLSMMKLVNIISANFAFM